MTEQGHQPAFDSLNHPREEGMHFSKLEQRHKCVYEETGGFSGGREAGGEREARHSELKTEQEESKRVHILSLGSVPLLGNFKLPERRIFTVEGKSEPEEKA